MGKMAGYIDFATIDKRDLFNQIRSEEITREDDLDQKERDPGHRYAHKYKKEKTKRSPDGSKPAKPNAYMEFVKEQVKQKGRAVRPEDYQKYADKWECLDPLTKNTYKTLAKDHREEPKTRENSPDEDSGEEDVTDGSGITLPAFENLVKHVNLVRERYGYEGLSEYGGLYCFFPPLCDPAPLVGRDIPEELEMVRGLYLIHAERECTADESILEEIKSRYPMPRLADMPVYVMHCVPLSRHADPVKAVSVPVELFVTSFTLKDGLGDVGFHAFVNAGDDLFIDAAGVNTRAAVPYGTTIFTNAEARCEAWEQAHLNHNVPFDGFEVLDRSFPVTPVVDLDRFYDGWDVYFRKVAEKSDAYYETYSTIIELLTSNGEDRVPAVFVGLQDVEVVEGCLRWLREKAKEQAERSAIPDDILAVKPIVLPLEYFLWKIAAELGKPVEENDIESALESKAPMEICDIRCSYHAQRPENIVCARSTVLLNIFNTFDVLLPRCGLPWTANHELVGEDEDEMSDLCSENGTYDDTEYTYPSTLL